MMLIIHKYKCTPFEQQSDVPNSDFIERRVCSQMGLSTQTHTCTYMHACTHQNTATATNTQPQTHTPFMESHTRMFWLFLAALLPSQSPLCQPAPHTALQLWFYIPVRQNYSLVHSVSPIRRSQFLVWTQTVGGYECEKGVSCSDKMIQALIDQQVLQWIENARGFACHAVYCSF